VLIQASKEPFISTRLADIDREWVFVKEHIDTDLISEIYFRVFAYVSFQMASYSGATVVYVFALPEMAEVAYQHDCSTALAGFLSSRFSLVP
jgi:hypothetical protein